MSLTFQKKSGLLSILPQPKHNAKVSTKMLIPQSVSNKPSANAKKKNPSPSPIKQSKIETKSTLITDYSDDSDDDVQNDFFSINKPAEELPDDVPLPVDTDHIERIQKEPRTLDSYFKKDHVDNNVESQIIEQEVSEHNISQSDFIPVILEDSANVLDEEAVSIDIL